MFYKRKILLKFALFNLPLYNNAIYEKLTLAKKFKLSYDKKKEKYENFSNRE